MRGIAIDEAGRVCLEMRGRFAEFPAAEGGVPAGEWQSLEHDAAGGVTRLFLVSSRPSGMWRTPAEWLGAWRDLRILLAPHTLYALEALDLGAGRALSRLRAPLEASGERVVSCEVLAGIVQVPLRTPTLPPARHTNAYIAGFTRRVVIDPAPYDEDERDLLLDALHGMTVDAIVLTHHHTDHVGAASWLATRLGGVPIVAHEITRDLLAGRIDVSRTVSEGDTIDLGPDAAGRAFTLGVLHTPGHAPGHVVLVDRRETPGRLSAMICGDMVAAVGTIIVDPPEGNMSRYVAELRRLAKLTPDLLFAAHGPPIEGGVAKLESYVTHRLDREAKVSAALERLARPARPSDLLPDAYADTPVFLYPLAARSCLAHLEKLAEDGKVSRDGDRFTTAKL